MNPDTVQPNLQQNPTGSPAPIMNDSSTMASTFNSAIQKAQQDPTSPFAQELMTRIKSGSMNDYLQAAGYDPSKFVTQQPTSTPTAAPQSNPSSSALGTVSDIGKNFSQQTQGHTANIVQDLSGKPSFTGAADVVGNVASEAGDILGSLFKLGYEATTPPPVKAAISAFGTYLANNQARGQVNSGETVQDLWSKFSAKNPDLAKNVANIGSAVALGAGTPDVNVGDIAEGVGQGVKTGAQMVADTVKSAPDVGGIVKAPINAAQDLATPINQNVMKILQNPTADTASTLKNMFSSAKEAVATTGAPSPFEIAGKNSFGQAMDVLKSKLTDAGVSMNSALAENGAKVVDTSAAQDAFNKGLQSRLGSAIDGEGNIVNAQGRMSTIANSPSDTKMIKLVQSTLSDLGASPTVQQVNDAVDSLQGQLYKAPMKGAEALNGNTQGFVKQIVGQLNGAAKDVAGEAYGAANDTYSNLKQLQNDLNGKLGANYKNAGAWTKRIFSPSDGGIKTLVQQLEQETGVPIFHDATLAKFAMDSVGDPRAASMLDQLQNVKSKGILQSTLDYVKGKLEDPEGVAGRIISKASIPKGEGEIPQTTDSPSKTEFKNGQFATRDPNAVAGYREFAKTQEPAFVKDTAQLAKQVNGSYLYRLKSEGSLMTKLGRRPWANLTDMGDTLGSTVITDPSKIDSAIQSAKNNFKITGVDDFRNADAEKNWMGYKAVHLDYETPSGMTAEMQLNTPEGIVQKEYAHTIYDKWRQYIEAARGSTKGDVLSKIPSEDRANFLSDIQKMNDIYNGKVAVPDEVRKAVQSRMVKP